MKHLTTLLALAIVLALTACGDVEIAPPEQETDTPAHQREIVLNLQNKLVFPPAGTRATEIATTDEKRIDALDVYVFGSPTLNGVYSYQEKFSYRADGSTVPGADILKMTGTDGSTATPTMMLKPHKGLFIKLYCVANQPDLCWLDNVTDPATPAYKPYTNFTPLTQSRPGEATNVVSPGVPLEADFRKLTTRVIDPVNEADSIVPALPLVGANVATIDLQDLALASRLFISVKLTRAVARFDIVNRADESRFTITSVALGNGRPTTSLFPLEAQRAADDGLITYPLRQFWGPGTNEGARLSAFYAYASPKADQGFLILNGTYRVNQTAPLEEVTHKIAFDQVKDGTGSYIEITPNHRYTVEITKADQYHVDFTVKVADWEEDEDMGIVIPDNSVGAISAQPEGLYDAKKKTLILSTTAGLNSTLTLSSNAALSVGEVTYDEPGYDWIEMGEVKMAPSTRGGIWTQTGTCEIRTRRGEFAKYPDATVQLVNKASGEKMAIKVKAPDDFIVVVPDGSGSRYDPVKQFLHVYAEPGLAATVTFKRGTEMQISSPERLPSSITIAESAKTDTTVTYTVTFDKYILNRRFQTGGSLYFKHSGTNQETRLAFYIIRSIDYIRSGKSADYVVLASDITYRNLYIDTSQGVTEVILEVSSDHRVDLVEEDFSSSWFTVERTQHASQAYDYFLLKLKEGQTPTTATFKLRPRIDLVPDVTITVQPFPAGEIYNGHCMMTLGSYKVIDGSRGGIHDGIYPWVNYYSGCPTEYTTKDWRYPSQAEYGTMLGVATVSTKKQEFTPTDAKMSVLPYGTYRTRDSGTYGVEITKDRKDGKSYVQTVTGYPTSTQMLIRCIKYR